MYQLEQSKQVLNGEVKKHGKRKVRLLLEHQGYSRLEVLSLVPVKEKKARKC